MCFFLNCVFVVYLELIMPFYFFPNLFDDVLKFRESALEKIIFLTFALFDSWLTIGKGRFH